jgi:hypothetical protein
MTAAVVVEVAPADESSPYARFLLEACTAGVRAGRCVFGRDAAPGDEGTAVAILTWEGETASNARIEVGVRVRGNPRWQTRFLSFSPTDPAAERWRAAGFAIATTVGEATAGEVPPSGGNSTLSGAPVHPPGEDARASIPGRPFRSWIDAQFSMTTGGQGSLSAVGGEVRVASKLYGDRAFLFGAAGCTLERMNVEGLSILRPSAAAGGGLVVLRLPGGVEFAIRARAVLQLIAANAKESATGVQGSGRRWIAGLGEGLDASWMVSRSAGFVVGVGAIETIGPTDFAAHGQVIAHIPAVGLDAAAGLRVAWP